MNQDTQIVEGNRLIKEFIKGDEAIAHLRFFDKSWNALMPVVEKIRDIHEMETVGNTISYLFSLAGKNERDDFNSINDLWQVVVQFIPWYNSTK